MLISYRWLRRHVDLEGITPDELARTLTICTAEVESVERWAPHLSDILVGLVATREPHPDADKLSLCTVDVGADEPLSIVCGAPNVDAGQKVAVATVGTALPGGLRIKKAKIRGVESRGMICSVKELELGEDHDGIWVLPEDAAVGTPVAEALGLEDWVLEIDNKSITHRPDLWGHRGFAREIAAIYGGELEALDLSLPETGDERGVPVRIDDSACSRYLALEIEDVRVTQSPRWMQNLLLAVGQRPLDLLVDLSNFVMLDLGQPNHLFDRGHVGDEGIVVRMARAGERMTTLDGVERALTGEDLLICAGDQPVALAGVMGGEGSKVAPGTTRLLLEVASFHPTVVRRTAARLGARTESSARFEKSLDPSLPERAAAHLVRLLADLQPDVSLPTRPTDVGDWSDPTCEVVLDPDRMRHVLGVDLTDRDATTILDSLGFSSTHEGEKLRVRVPSWRATKDVSIEEDLYEEVARIHGLSEIPERTLVARVVPPPRDPRRESVRELSDRLAGGARFHEVLCYSFLSDDLAKRLGVANEEFVRVVNPVAEGEDRIRRGVVPSLLGLVEKNRRHTDDVRLFEIGKGTLPEHTDERGQPREVHELGLVLAAPRPGKKARFDSGAFPRLQGVVDDLLVHVGHANARWAPFEEGAAPPPWAHPGRSLRLVVPGPDGAELELGLLTELDPGLHRPLGLVEELAGEVAIARVSLDALLAAPRVERAYRPIPRYPGNKVDVALAAPEEVPCADLVQAIERSGKGLVASVELFDLYRGESVGAGRRSLAFHVLLQSDAKTLTDADGQKFLGRLEHAVERLGAELRRE